MSDPATRAAVAAVRHALRAGAIVTGSAGAMALFVLAVAAVDWWLRSFMQ